MKDFPPIPEPKARSKARYSLVVIGETGRSSQFELTPARVGIGIGVLVVIGVVCSVCVAGGLFARSAKSQPSAGDPALVHKIAALEDQLRQKEVALSVQEKRLKELQELPRLAATAPVGPSSEGVRGQPPPKRSSPTDGGGPLMSVPQQSPADALEEPSAAGDDTLEPVPAQRRPPGQASEAQEAPAEPTESEAGRAPLINFNAQRVTAASDPSGNGTISFRLVKDHPSVRFSGYLFVFVEMTDSRSENKIYSYPKKARLGDEDLPLDYREGESVSFKYNSRVELPFGDPRPGANLVRVSILLYGQDGRIVFQRGFDGREIKMVAGKEGPADRTGQKTAEKRRAL